MMSDDSVAIFLYFPTSQTSPKTDTSQIAKFMGPTGGPPGPCRPQMGPMFAPWTLLSGIYCNMAIPVSRPVTWHYTYAAHPFRCHTCGYMIRHPVTAHRTALCNDHINTEPCQLGLTNKSHTGWSQSIWIIEEWCVDISSVDDLY